VVSLSSWSFRLTEAEWRGNVDDVCSTWALDLHVIHVSGIICEHGSFLLSELFIPSLGSVINMARTVEDIENEITEIKNHNPQWCTNNAVKALIAALTNEKTHLIGKSCLCLVSFLFGPSLCASLYCMSSNPCC
jgi:hypothetical protein